MSKGRAGSPDSTISSTGGDSINNIHKLQQGVSNLARADANLIPVPSHELNNNDSNDFDNLSSNLQANLALNPSIHDRSISFVEGTQPNLHLFQNQLNHLSSKPDNKFQLILQRAFTTPVHSKLGHLANPNFNSSNFIHHSSDDGTDLGHDAFQSQVSQELADLVQLTVQTIVQLSPPHLLDQAKEQYAACGLTFPTPSVSSFLTISKALNYLSVFSSSRSKSKRRNSLTSYSSWDIGEMLQGVADCLAGFAAERSINIVIFHGGSNLQHVSVKGGRPSINESSLSFGLIHILRKIMHVCLPGSSIEICLHLVPDPYEDEDKTNRLTCTFEIYHHNPETENNIVKEKNIPSPFLANLVTRQILSDLVVDLRSRPVLPSLPNDTSKRRYDFVLTLYEGEPLDEPQNLSPEDEATRQPFGYEMELAREPTLKELTYCATKILRDSKIEFFCNPNSLFAKHVTGYLSSWGMLVEHHSTEAVNSEEISTKNDVSKVSSNDLSTNTESYSSADLNNDDIPHHSLENEKNRFLEGSLNQDDEIKEGTEFVIIDDDIQTFKSRLNEVKLQAINSYHKSLASQTKQSDLLTRRHSIRSNSNSSVTPEVIDNYTDNKPNKKSTSEHHQRLPCFLHFTSLDNYKVVIDAVISARAPLDSSSNDHNINFELPNIQILPKPAGPRRLLTALHTAIHKPVVDPHFKPLATTPLSPSIFSATSGPYSSRLSSYNYSNFSFPGRNEESDKSQLDIGVRDSIHDQLSQNTLSPSQTTQLLSSHPRSSASNSISSANNNNNNATSPMDTTAMNYFSNKAAQLGDGNKGMVIQSHDGRAAGLFFNPTHSPLEEGKEDDNDNSEEGFKGSNLSHSLGLPPKSKRTRRPSAGANANTNIGLNRGGSTRRAAMYKPNIGLREMIEKVSTKSPNPDEDDESKPNNLVSRASTTIIDKGENQGRPDTLSHSHSDPVPTLYDEEAPTLTSLPKFTFDDTQVLLEDQQQENQNGEQLTQQKENNFQKKNNESHISEETVKSSQPSTSKSEDSANTMRATSEASTATISSNLNIPSSYSPSIRASNTNPFDEKEPSARSPGERPALNTRQRSRSILKSIKDAAQAARRDVQNKYNDSTKAAQTGNIISSGWLNGGITPPVNVLIVEDNPINQTILKKFMTRRNVTYDIALNGEEAVEKWRTGTFHLILMDLALPILSGVEAARQIRAHEKNQNIGVFPSTPPSELPQQNHQESVELPQDSSIRSFASSIQTNFKFRSPVIIVALTASSATSDRVAALEAGCNDFLTKPVNFHWLERKIIEWGCMQALIDVDGWRNFRLKRFQ